MEPLGADARVEPLLAADEAVLVSCPASLLVTANGPTQRCPLGNLYLTSSRLLHLGAETVVVDLDTIGEVMLQGDALSMTTRDGDTILLEVEEPRLLRVQIAAARMARRRRAETRPAARAGDR